MTSSVESWSGASRGWRYLAQRIDGTGTPGIFLDTELPLRDVSITDVLSGPPQLTGTISPVYRRLLGPDGLPVLGEWATAIYAEADGIIRSGTLLVDATFSGPEWGLDSSGFASYAKGMGYEAAQKTFLGVDPLDVVRHAWSHIQGGQASNLGLVVDSTTKTDQKVGKAAIPDPDGTGPETATDAEPLIFAAWLTDDLGDEIDQLARDHGFEYHERHEWNADKTAVNHFLDFGYPTIGARKDLRFVLGENVQTKPQFTRSGSSYANHIRFLGAGEGSAMIREEARISDGRLRRMLTLDDKDVRDRTRAKRIVRDELARRLAIGAVSSVVVRNTDQAPLGSWGVGDEIRLQAELDWISFDLWFRVLSITIKPEDPEIISMSLKRSDA